MKKGLSRLLQETGVAASLVVVASMIAGAGTMAAIAAGTSDSALPSPVRNEVSSPSSSSATISSRKEKSKKKTKITAKTKSNKKKTTKVSAENIKRIPIGDFNKINVTGCICVVFTQGASKGYAEIHASQQALSRIELTINKSELRIFYNDNVKINNGMRTVVYLDNPDIESVKISDASSFTVSGTLNVSNLQVSASDASSINIPSVAGNKISLSCSDASTITVLSAEMKEITAAASDASSIKIKGICAGSVVSKANDASTVSVIGRCNNKKSTSSDASSVKDQGLIIESQRLDCGASLNHRIPPRQP